MRIVIAGAGSVGTFIAEDLAKAGHEVVIVEVDADRVAEGERLGEPAGATWVAADACEVTEFARAGVDRADVVAAVTGDDEDNLVISLLAKQEFAVPRVVARVNNPKNEWMFTEMWGVDVSVSTPHLLTALVEEAVSVEATSCACSRSKAAGPPLRGHARRGVAQRGQGPRRARPAPGLHGGGHHRDSHVIVPRGDGVLRAGDEVLVLTTPRPRGRGGLTTAGLTPPRPRRGAPTSRRRASPPRPWPSRLRCRSCRCACRGLVVDQVGRLVDASSALSALPPTTSLILSMKPMGSSGVESQRPVGRRRRAGTLRPDGRDGNPGGVVGARRAWNSGRVLKNLRRKLATSIGARTSASRDRLADLGVTPIAGARPPARRSPSPARCQGLQVVPRAGSPSLEVTISDGSEAGRWQCSPVVAASARSTAAAAS
ncbi:MAG: TrkA family potassium uptake protein [Acidimicrobiales bacterium]